MHRLGEHAQTPPSFIDPPRFVFVAVVITGECVKWNRCLLGPVNDTGFLLRDRCLRGLVLRVMAGHGAAQLSLMMAISLLLALYNNGCSL